MTKAQTSPPPAYAGPERRHVYRRQTDRPATCSKCGDVFTTPGFLRRHMKRFHQVQDQ